MSGLRLVPMLLVATCGFGSSEPDRTVRSDSAGVEIVVSSGESRTLPWRFEPVWTAGGAADERLMLAELAASDVSVGQDERVYVLDRTASRVLVFSPAGEVVDTLGREGGGPGELESPLALTVDRQEAAVAVFDFAKGGLVRWSEDGEVLPGTAIDAMVWGQEVEVTAGGTLFVTFDGRTGASTRLSLLSWSPDAEHALARFTTAPHRPGDFPTCGQRGVLVSPLFSPELLWDAEGLDVAVSTGAAYVIDLYRENRRVRSIRREVPPRAVTEEMALRDVGEGLYFGAVDCTIPPTEAVRGHGYADELPAVGGLAVSPAGEVWALRGRVADEPNRTDVFRSDGSYAGTLEAASPFPAAFLPGDRIVAVEKDSLEVPVVTVYRIEDRETGNAGT